MHKDRALTSTYNESAQVPITASIVCTGHSEHAATDETQAMLDQLKSTVTSKQMTLDYDVSVDERDDDVGDDCIYCKGYN